MNYKSIFLSIICVVLFSCTAETKSSTKMTTPQIQTPVLSNIDVAQCKKLLETNEDVQLVDVRTNRECNAGMIDKAVQIDISSEDFKTKIEQLDKDKPVVLYCAVGGRSSRAAQYLKSVGFKEVYNLKGGINAWKSKGYTLK